MNHEYIFANRQIIFLNSTYFSNILNWNDMIIIISFPSISRVWFRNVFRCATQHLEVRSTAFVRVTAFSTNTFVKKLLPWESTTLSKYVLHFGFSCRRCIHSFLKIHYKDLLYSFNFKLQHNSKSFRNSKVITLVVPSPRILQGFPIFKMSVCYFTDFSK